MYLDFFSFTERPFDITPDTRFLYLSPQHEAAIETLLYGILERRGFMVMTGEVGTGKTTSIRELLNRLNGSVETALVINPLLSTPELLKVIARDFGLPTNGNSILQDIESLNAFLLENERRGRGAAVLIDEAQDLSLEALEMVRLLSNLETETRKLLQLVLVGQPELEGKLASEDLRQLRQRIQLRCRLDPLGAKETEGYILHRLSRASPRAGLVFQPSAFERIHECTGGVPRLINSLCELVLLAAYTRETHVITRRLVEVAYHEMADKPGGRPWWSRIGFMGRRG